MKVKGNLVDIHNELIYPAEVIVGEGRILAIRKIEDICTQFILPGFIDSHIHIESSLLTPANFASVALSHGTIATVSDPHEIANVCGIDGVNYMIQNGNETQLKFFWTAPSCVPATQFETSGAELGLSDIQKLFENPYVVALGEMMNYPGIVNDDFAVKAKCEASLKSSRVNDGHAPGLSGADLKKYVSAGISTDHECANLEEALEKISLGMKVLIREGSSAKNFEALFSLLISQPEKTMLCSDDLHADDLIKGHVNLLVIRSLSMGIPLFNVLKAVSLNPVLHYNLPVGLLREKDPADFIVVNNLEEFQIKETWINGRVVYSTGEKMKFQSSNKYINNFQVNYTGGDELIINSKGNKARVIEVEEGSILTKESIIEIKEDLDSFLKENKLLKLYVKNRYSCNSSISKALVKGFGGMNGAIVSTIAHDSHNIIAIGNKYDDIHRAIELIIENKGGISFVCNETNTDIVLPLPIAGLMSILPAREVAIEYEKILNSVREHGCILNSPLMTLSFLALLVIPSLKLSDKGLFDVNSFSFTDLFFE